MSDDVNLTPAQHLVWALYTQSISERLKAVMADFLAGRTTTLGPSPLPQSLIVTAEKMLSEARADGRAEVIDDALMAAIRACDAIDNARSKSESVKAARKELDKAYHVMRALKHGGDK